MTFHGLLRNDIYNFSQDIHEYVRVITRSEKSLLVDVECTSLGDFVKAVKNQPRILHLSCHSDWNQESKVFNLFFENSKLELI